MKSLMILMVISGCAAFNNEGIYTHGNTACVGSCEGLQPIIAELHTQEMIKRICDAGADTPECK